MYSQYCQFSTAITKAGLIACVAIAAAEPIHPAAFERGLKSDKSAGSALFFQCSQAVLNH